MYGQFEHWKYNPKITITIESVYLNGIKLPQGYKFTGKFKPPKANEEFLGSKAGNYATIAFSDFPEDSPRLILERIKRKVVTFTETGEVRTAKAGEWYKYTGIDGSEKYQQATYLLSYMWSIVTRTESEI